MLLEEVIGRQIDLFQTGNWLINKQTIKIRRPNFNRPWQHVLDPLYG